MSQEEPRLIEPRTCAIVGIALVFVLFVAFLAVGAIAALVLSRAPTPIPAPAPPVPAPPAPVVSVTAAPAEPAPPEPAPVASPDTTEPPATAEAPPTPEPSTSPTPPTPPSPPGPRDWVADLAPLLEDKPVESAAACADAGIRKIALLGPGGARHAWTSELPEGWVASSVGETQLVAIFSAPREEVIDTQKYGMTEMDPNAQEKDRVRISIDVRVVEARTGRELASTTFTGSEPRAFEEKESDTAPIKGEPPKWSADVRDFLAGCVDASLPHEAIRIRPKTRHVECLAFTPDGRKLLGGGELAEKKSLWLWDLANAKVVGSWTQPEGAQIRSIAFVGADRFLAGHGVWFCSPQDEPHVKYPLALHRIGAAAPVWTSTEQRCPYDRIALSSDGKVAATLTFGSAAAASVKAPSEVRIWDLATGKLTRTLPGEGTLAIHVTATELLEASKAGAVRAISLATGEEVRRGYAAPAGGPFAPSAMTFSRDGKRLLVVGAEVQLVDARTGETECRQPARHKADEAGVASVALTSDAKRAVVATWDSRIRIYDLEGGGEPRAVVLPVPAKNTGAPALAISADDSMFAGAIFEGPIVVWKMGR